MVNYVKHEIWSVKVRAGGVITAGAPVKYDAAQGAGILAASVGDEEFTGFAKEDCTDAATMRSVLVIGSVAMKVSGKVDCLEPVTLDTAVDQVDSSTTADLVIGLNQTYAAAADTTNRVYPLLIATPGVGTYWAEA